MNRSDRDRDREWLFCAGLFGVLALWGEALPATGVLFLAGVDLLWFFALAAEALSEASVGQPL